MYARLPAPGDCRFGLAADLERRLLAQRDKVLDNLKHPFPYVAQTGMRWKMTDGETGKVIAKDIPQATIYPRHFWFPAAAYHPGNNGVVVLETWIRSDRDIECGAWIGMTGFSRSDGRSRDAPTPKTGQWNKHGATIEINGAKIAPPKWNRPGTGGNPKEIPLSDEDYWYREPTRIKLEKGVNHVKNAVACTCTEVDDVRTLELFGICEGCNMTESKVNYMDVVSYACAVVCVVVVTMNAELFELTYSNL